MQPDYSKHVTIETFVVDRYSHQWDRIWSVIASDPINAGLPEPTEAYNAECCEYWQYMGSFLDQEQDRECHEFRHRCHPTTQRREYRRVYLDPDQSVNPIPYKP